MKPISRILVYGAIAVVLYDAVFSLASRTLGFDYSNASVGSYLIYGITGFFAARVLGWKGAALAGVVLGLVDATIGWGVSWLIGPGRLAENATFTPWMWPVIALTVCATAVIFALAGALLARLSRRKPQARNN